MLQVRPLTAEEGPEVVQLDSRCFTRSRFHLDSCKSRWNGRHDQRCLGRGSRLEEERELLDGAFLGDGVVGFNDILRAKTGGKDVSVTELISVDPAHQRFGIGYVMVAHFLAWSADGSPLVRLITKWSSFQWPGFTIGSVSDSPT